MFCAFCKKNNSEIPFIVWDSNVQIHDICFKDLEKNLTKVINNTFPNTVWRNEASYRAIQAIKKPNVNKNLIAIGVEAIIAYNAEVNQKYKLRKTFSYH